MDATKPLTATLPPAASRLTSAIRRGSSSANAGVTFATPSTSAVPIAAASAHDPRGARPTLPPLTTHHELEEQARAESTASAGPLESATNTLTQWQEQALESVAQTLFSKHFTQQKLRVHHSSHAAGGDGNGDEGIGAETAEDDPLGPVSGQRRLLSSIPLQLLLIFNATLLPVWFGIMVSVTSEKFADWAARNVNVNEFYSFTLHFTLIVFTICEPARLLLGWRGNRNEKIPDLAGFLLLTVLPQILILLYYPFIQRAHSGSQIDALEVSVNVIYMLLVLPQLPLAYRVTDRVFLALCIPNRS
ncbi:hypothetical protein BCR44DRAFT_1439539 [Catenaria anguillulae PL171]|uniref:Uncharacterized protein n=1 Tax=Catenaria anguillulae PL171 TaxID=765915 RepID=A0A1Y2HDU8_9FUNG|nr:hypothetical protein BCR44DRAFT_1439539 [Catenaria anguillulae PL171]